MDNSTAGTARQMANAPQTRADRKQNRQPQPAALVETSEAPATVAELLHDDSPDSVFDEPTAPRGTAARLPLDFLRSLYPPESISFKTKILEPGAPWANGTISRQVATCVIPMHDPITGLATGFEIRGARIVKKSNGGKSVIDLQMPSTGGKFKSPVMDTDVQRSEDGFNRWRREVASRYTAFRTAEVAADKNNGATIVTDSSIATDGDALAALGL